MVLASWVLNLQLMVAWAVLRSDTKAWISRRRASSLGRRRPRQERASTLNSISAIACPVLDTGFSQLPCLGV